MARIAPRRNGTISLDPSCRVDISEQGSLESSQVNTLPNAKSQAKNKRAKDRQQYAALRCKVGVAPSGFEVNRHKRKVLIG